MYNHTSTFIPGPQMQPPVIVRSQSPSREPTTYEQSFVPCNLPLHFDLQATHAQALPVIPAQNHPPVAQSQGWIKDVDVNEKEHETVTQVKIAKRERRKEKLESDKWLMNVNPFDVTCRACGEVIILDGEYFAYYWIRHKDVCLEIMNRVFEGWSHIRVTTPSDYVGMGLPASPYIDQASRGAIYPGSGLRPTVAVGPPIPWLGASVMGEMGVGQQSTPIMGHYTHYMPYPRPNGGWPMDASFGVHFEHKMDGQSRHVNIEHSRGGRRYWRTEGDQVLPTILGRRGRRGRPSGQQVPSPKNYYPATPAVIQATSSGPLPNRPTLRIDSQPIAQPTPYIGCVSQDPDDRLANVTPALVSSSSSTQQGPQAQLAAYTSGFGLTASLRLPHISDWYQTRHYPVRGLQGPGVQAEDHAALRNA